MPIRAHAAGGRVSPRLALGRPRGSATGRARMTLLRRRPRELYRVYREDEFLEIDDWQDEAEGRRAQRSISARPDLGDPVLAGAVVRRSTPIMARTGRFAGSDRIAAVAAGCGGWRGSRSRRPSR